MPTPSQMNDLRNILGWVRTAKENLPAINDGRVAADRIALLSGLLDRMHRAAIALGDDARQPAPADVRVGRLAA